MLNKFRGYVNTIKGLVGDISVNDQEAVNQSWRRLNKISVFCDKILLDLDDWTKKFGEGIESIGYKKLLDAAEDSKMSFLTRDELYRKVIDGESYSPLREEKSINVWNDKVDRDTFNATIRVGAGTTVLDMGCGRGEHISILLDHKPTRRCVGVDKKDDRILDANAKNLNPKNTMFLVGDISAEDFIKNVCGNKLLIPEDTRHFDTVILHQVIEHMEGDAAYTTLRNAFAIANKNVFISVPIIDSIRFTDYHYLVPEHMVAVDHKIFFTKKLLFNFLQRVLTKSGRGAKLTIKPYLKYADFASQDLHYYCMAVVEFDDEDSSTSTD